VGREEQYKKQSQCDEEMTDSWARCLAGNNTREISLHAREPQMRKKRTVDEVLVKGREEGG
jgi:hypothetical protein